MTDPGQIFDLAADPGEKAEMKVSVIVPALNEEKNIRRCLEALCAMTASTADFEVIVVDNGSTDKTVEVAGEFSRRLNLRTLHSPGVRISALRNLGAQNANGDVLAFLDADCLVPTSWLSFAVPLFSGSHRGIVGGFYGLEEMPTWVASVWHRHYHVTKSGEVPFVPSGDLLVDRATFRSLSGFDESLETNEDYDFCVRVRLSGATVRCYPELKVVHLGTPQTLAAFYRQQKWHGKHALKVFLREPGRMHNLKPLLFGTALLACMGGFGLSFVYALLIGNVRWLIGFAASILLVPAVASLLIAVRSGHYKDVVQLTVLHMVYGWARAVCLLHGTHGASGNRRLSTDKGLAPAAGAKP